MRSKSPAQLSAGFSPRLAHRFFFAGKCVRAVAAVMAMVAMGCVPAFAAAAATTTTLTMTSGGATVASGGTVVSPSQVTLTATVLAGATPVTSGTVLFCRVAPACSDINLIGTAQLTAAGTASLTFVPAITAPNSATPPVTTPHSYDAVFLPTQADLSSTSAVSTLYVTGTFPTTSVLTSVETGAAPPYVYTLVDTVTGSTQAYPTGTVSFYDTSNVLTPAQAGPPAVPATYVQLGTAPIVTGSSSFVLTAHPSVPTGSEPRYVNVGDLNGDGIPDLVVSNFDLDANGYSTVDVFFGKGDATFKAGQVFEIYKGYGPQFSALGDFENNGCLDIITEAYQGQGLYYFHNTKTAGVCTGTFTASQAIYNAGTNAPGIYGPGALGVGDFNGDGNLDFIVANNSDAAADASHGAYSTIFFGNGNGTFSTTTTRLTPTGGVINPVFFAVADYNGDGFPDIAIGNNATNTINIYLNSGTGTFTLHSTLATVGGNNTVLAADVNKDGKLDLVVASSDTADAINVWLGDGTGGFAKATTDPPVPNPSALQDLALADTNGDGNVDIVTNTNPNNGTAGNVFVLLGNGNDTFQAPTATQSDGGLDTLSLAVGDFNDDGYADVALGNFSSNNVAIYTAGYQTTGTATANLPGVTVYGQTVSPHLADAVFPTGSVYTTSTSNTVNLIPNILPLADETLTLTATPNATYYGQQVALQAKFVYTGLGPSYQPNGETVTFYQVAAGGTVTVLGTATLGTVGTPGCSTVTTGAITTTCTSTVLNITTLPIGTDNIEVSYNLIAPPALPNAPGTNNPADTNFTGLISSTIPVVVTQVPGTADTVTANPNPSTYGDPDVLTFCIPVVTGAAAPVGSVQFSYGTPAVNLNGAVTIGTTPTVFNGTSCYLATTTTSALPVNSSPGDVVKAAFTANPTTSGYASASPTTTVPVTQAPVNNPIPADTSLSQTFTASTTPATNPTTQTFGNPVTLTYNIPVAAGNTPPIGPVTFTTGTTTLGTCGAGSTFTPGSTFVVSGITFTNYTCSISTSALPVGNPDTVTATYTASDPNYGNTPALTAQVFVNAATTTAILNATPTPAPSGTPVTLTESLVPVGGVCPTGLVTFYVGGTLTGSTVTGGTVVTPSTGLNPAIVVASPPAGPATSCVATIQTTSLPVGTENIFATEPASTGFTAVGSGPKVVTVTQNPSTGDTVTVTPSANPDVYGDAATITFSIPVVANSMPPAGTVTFSAVGANGATVTLSETPTYNFTTAVNGFYTATIATPVVTGTGTSTTTLPVGAPTAVTATFVATSASGYASGTPTTNQPVQAVPTSSLGYTPTAPTPTCGTTLVTLTDTIAEVDGVLPTGSVQFYVVVNGVAQKIGAPVPVTAASNGVVSLAPIAIPCGTSGAYGIFTGTGSYGNSTTPTVPLATQIAGGDTVTVTPSATPDIYGDAATITFSIPVVAGQSAPVGTVVFSAVGANGAPVTLAETPTYSFTTPVNGFYTATIVTPGITPSPTGTSTTTLPIGAPTAVTATFTANGGGYASGAPSTTQVVVPAPPTVVTYGPSAPTCGTTLVTFTDTITAVDGVIPTGTVQFYVVINGVSQPIGAPVTVNPANNGVATLAPIVVPCGTTGVYAIFTGNAPYPVTTAPTVPLALSDFTIAATPPIQTVNPGGTLVYTVNLAGAGGVAFNAPVTLTATGLPTGATVSFGTPTYVPGLGPTPTTMTIVTSPAFAKLDTTHHGNGIFYGLLLLPLLGLKRVRRKIRALPRGVSYCLAALVLLGGVGALAGCNGGYFGAGPKTYTIVVTGTSGTLTHSTSVQLTLE